MAIELPQFSEQKLTNPRKLFLFSHTKVGKTELVSALPNNLVIDTEDGSEFVSGFKFNVMKYGKMNNMQPTKVLRELAEQIQKENTAKGDYVYDYITIDTATGLEKYARVLATHLYKQTQMGKSYKGEDVVSELPQGAGYDYLRKAFDRLYGMFTGVSRYGLIITGHVKNASINKDGKELQARDIQLTGKLKTILAQDCDAIGYLYRNKENMNEVIVSFKTNELDLATGARAKHLRGQEFVISELKDDQFTFYWDKIFIPEEQALLKVA